MLIQGRESAPERRGRVTEYKPVCPTLELPPPPPPPRREVSDVKATP